MLAGGAFTALLLLLLLLWSPGASAVSGELDFPPVELREEDSGMSVSFTHPLLFYRELKRPPAATLNFTVSTDARDFPSLCPVSEDICRRVISLPAGEQKCVSVRRAFIGGSHGAGAAFRDTGRICLSGFPPENLRLSCRNVSVVASWTSSLRRPQTFRVHVGGSAGHAVSQTSERHFDLSRFVWQSEERYMAVHAVTVATLEGGNQSAAATTTFTFNDQRLAHHKCRLSFPPVGLTQTDSGASLTFTNPFHFYKALQEADKPDTAAFSFTAVSAAGDDRGVCPVTREKCQLDISFPADTEKCIRLQGALFQGSQVGIIVFNQTELVCADASSEFYDLTLVLILLVVCVVIGVLVFFIWKAKAWTLRMTSPPEPLIKEIKHHDRVMKFALVSPEDISELTVYKPCKSLSVGSQEDQDLTEKLQDPPGRLQDPMERFQVGTRLHDEEHLPDGYGGDEDSTGSSMKTVSSDLEEVLQEEEEDEEEVLEVRVYDRPKNLQVDMGDGEMVSAYMES